MGYLKEFLSHPRTNLYEVYCTTTLSVGDIARYVLYLKKKGWVVKRYNTIQRTLKGRIVWNKIQTKHDKG